MTPFIPTRRDIELWRLEAEMAIKSSDIKRLGQFNWPQAVLSLIAEWEGRFDRNHPAAREALSPDLDWKAGGRVHNWRNYVGDTMRTIWPTMTDDQKAAIAINADEISGREEWD